MTLIHYSSDRITPLGAATFLSPIRGGRGDGVSPLHLPPIESHSNTEEQAARKPPVPVVDKKVTPPSRRQESHPSKVRGSCPEPESSCNIFRINTFQVSAVTSVVRSGR